MQVTYEKGSHSFTVQDNTGQERTVSITLLGKGYYRVYEEGNEAALDTIAANRYESQVIALTHIVHILEEGREQ